MRSLLRRLEDLALDDRKWVFRGHQSKSHRLRTSLERYWNLKNAFGKTDQVLKKFRDGLIRAGIPTPATTDRLSWLEIARHHGAPTPLLDFSWSPYVALFFAFNGIPYRPERRCHSVLYALNVSQLAEHQARSVVQDPMGPGLVEAAARFESPDRKILSGCLPDDALLFLPYAGEHAQRMQRQRGAFLYCTLDYEGRGFQDLEGYIGSLNDTLPSPTLRNTNAPTLIRFEIPHTLATQVFSHLDLARVSGEMLFGTAEGVAQDIWNSFHHSRFLPLRTDTDIGD